MEKLINKDDLTLDKRYYFFNIMSMEVIEASISKTIGGLYVLSNGLIISNIDKYFIADCSKEGAYSIADEIKARIMRLEYAHNEILERGLR